MNADERRSEEAWRGRLSGLNKLGRAASGNQNGFFLICVHLRSSVADFPLGFG